MVAANKISGLKINGNILIEADCKLCKGTGHVPTTIRRVAKEIARPVA